MSTSYPPALAMPSAPSEEARRRALEAYGILDTGPEAAFDDLTALASHICGAPGALITFIDGNRLWFKSAHGLTAREAPVEHSFCAHAAGDPDAVFVIGNALSDGRFLQNVFVKPVGGIRAYAGANILTPDGTPLGSICVVDFEERDFSPEQEEALRRLSRQVSDQLELRRRVRELEVRERALASANAQLEAFAQIVSHDFRGPLRNIAQMAEVLGDDLTATPSVAELGEGLGHIRRSAARALTMFDDVADFLQAGLARPSERGRVDLREVFAEVAGALPEQSRVAVRFASDEAPVVYTQRSALRHILLNLVGNAVKYNHRRAGRVEVRATVSRGELELCVSDDGPGIPDAERARIFEVFRRGSTSTGSEGRGIGLALVRRLATGLGGDVTLASAEGEGCTFTVRLPQNMPE